MAAAVSAGAVVRSAGPREKDDSAQEAKHTEEPPKEPAPKPASTRSGLRRIYNTVEEAMAATGTDSPSEALRQIKSRTPDAVYLPHTGAKQRAKELKRAAKLAEKVQK